MKRFLYVLCFCFFIVGCGTNAKPEPLKLIEQDASPDLQDQGSDADMTSDLGDMNGVDMMDMAPDVGEDMAVVPVDIADALAALPGVVIAQEQTGQNNTRIFTIDITQRLDNFSDNSTTFVQRMHLFHRDIKAPVVLVTSGYGLGEAKDYQQLRTEVGQLLGGNEIFLGHRFFKGALPDPVRQDWSKVNIKQGAADNHHIVQTLKAIYKSPWVGTGWSKGGMTALFHERFYPDDLDLVIPMVAPISQTPNDTRYPPFLAEIGTEACRTTLEQSIIATLGRVEEMLNAYQIPPRQRPQYRAQFKQQLLSYQWAYWQYLGDRACNAIPDGMTASIEVLANFYFYFQLPNQPGFPITEEDAFNYTYGYQAATQLGYPTNYPAGYLEKMVMLGHITETEKAQYLLPYRDLYAVMPPWDTLPMFDPAPMQDISTWLKTDATNILAIYGEYDPWTAGKITLNDAKQSKVYVAPKGSHSTFLQDLTAEDYQEVEARILRLKPSPLSLTQQRQRPAINRVALTDLLRNQKL